MARFSLWSWLAILGIAALVALSVCFLVKETNLTGPLANENDGEPQPANHRPGFREAAAASGLTFQMKFLPDEQGEKFKINLYDHGCGLAIGDYDGDGHDDIYFCNQLGKNVLYHNKGDGTFEDVTAKAGVGVGDRVCVAATWADTRNIGVQ